MRLASSMEIEDDELRAYVDEALGIGPATWGHRSDGGDRSTGDGSHDRLDSEFDDWECAGDRDDDGPAAERLSKKRRGTRHTPSSSLEKDWKLVKGETDSNIEGMESHIARAMAQSLPKQPWESSPAAKVFNPDYLKGPGYMRVGLSDALLGNVARSSSPPRPVPRAIPEFVARRLRMASLNKSDDCLRSGALMKARSLLLYDPPATQLGQSLLNAAGTLIDENQVTQSLIDAFAPKSTNTLVKRFSSLWRFARWCSAKYIPPLQMAEDTVYDYLCHLRDEKASASAASSFLEPAFGCVYQRSGIEPAVFWKMQRPGKITTANSPEEEASEPVDSGDGSCFGGFHSKTFSVAPRSDLRSSPFLHLQLRQMGRLH